MGSGVLSLVLDGDPMAQGRVDGAVAVASKINRLVHHLLVDVRRVVEGREYSFSCSPSTWTSSEASGCLYFLSSRTTLRPVQLPRAPSSISVGRIAESSPKIGGSSMLAVWPEADSISNLTLVPLQRAIAFAIDRNDSRILARG